MNFVVKQGGGNEAFNAGKLYNSLYSTMLSTRTAPGQARQTANAIVKDVQLNLNSGHVTSDDIRRAAFMRLERQNPHAAYMYRQQNTAPHFHEHYAPDPVHRGFQPGGRLGGTSFMNQPSTGGARWWESDRRNY